MGLWELLWLLLILSGLSPALKKKRLEVSRRRLITKIEEEHGSRVIILIHRQETMSLFGVPLYRYIDINDSEEVIRAIHLTDPEVPIDLILHTPGGLVLAALQIAWAIKKHPGKVTVYVPHYAMSGGTLIALAADEIVMDEHAVLGPVDPQIENLPAASLRKLVREKPVSEISDRAMILADVAAKALHQVRQAVFNLLVDQYGEEKADRISNLLAEGYWTHDYPLTFEEIKALGLNVRNNLPHSIYELMRLFPQPVRQQPSVAYLPERREKPEPR
ncbi:MAG TPA: ATP-dependent Clp protease proteolytic subunit [Capillibacterium sp.]